MKYKLINSVTKTETICDKVTIDGFDYYVSDGEIKDDDWYYWSVTNTIQKAVKDFLGRLPKSTDGSKKVIATNNPNIDVPKIVDEIDLDNLLGEWKYKLGLKESKDKADEKFEKGYSVDSVKDKISHRLGYVYGIKEAEKRLVPIIMELKSQETHPFSEEDMIEFSEWYFKETFNTELEYTFKSTKKLLQLWKEQKSKIVYYGND